MNDTRNAQVPNPHILISGYLDGLLNDEQFEQFQQWIMNDRENARIFARTAMLQEDVIARLRRDDVSEFMNEGSKGDFVFSEMLLEAVEEDRKARIKREAEAALEKQQSESREAERRASMRRLAGMSNQDAGPRTRHYVIPKPLFYGSIAAVVAIATAIIWPMIDRSPLQVNGPVPVATLVDDALPTWAGLEQGIAKDEKMIPGEYVLEQGIAKIRFNNGALLTVEAPATFELLDDDLVKLRSGRIVGYCEEDGSKGFTVITPSTRVIDLGTEFGIDVTIEGTIAIEQVHVFDGIVRATAVDKSSSDAIKSLTLVQGTAAFVRKDASGLTMNETDADSDLFVNSRSGLIDAKDFQNVSFETQSVRKSAEFKWPDKNERGVALLGRKYFRTIDGWQSSRVEVVENAVGPEIPWLIGLQIAPFRPSDPGGTTRQSRDGEQVLTLVPGRDKKNRVWVYQSVGRVGFEDVGRTLTANAYAAARDKHTLPATDGGTVTLGFATDVTDRSSGRNIGDVHQSETLMMEDAPQVLDAACIIEKKHIGKELFLVVLAHDPTTQTEGTSAAAYFVDDVKLKISQPRRGND